MTVARAETVLAIQRDGTARRDDPAAHGGMVAIRPAAAAHSLRDTVRNTAPCPTGVVAILCCGFAWLACVAPVALPAVRCDQIVIPGVAIAEAGFAPPTTTGDVLPDEAVAPFGAA